MTRDEYLNLLKDKGLLYSGIQSGAIDLIHVKHAEIRAKFAKMKPKDGYTRAVCKLAYEYRLSESQIKLVVK